MEKNDESKELDKAMFIGDYRSIQAKEGLFEQFDNNIFNALVEKIDILLSTYFVFVFQLKVMKGKIIAHLCGNCEGRGITFRGKWIQRRGFLNFILNRFRDGDDFYLMLANVVKNGLLSIPFASSR